MKRRKLRPTKRRKPILSKHKASKHQDLNPINEVAIQDRVVKAFEYQQAGRLSEAAKLYRQVLEYQKDHFDALHMLGIVTHQLGNSDEACELVSKALNIRPDNAEAHNSLAIILSSLKQTTEAITHLDRALDLRPNFPEALNNKGNALRANGALASARDHFERAIALAPNYGQAHGSLGIVLVEMKDPEAAKNSLDNALRLTPDDPNIWSNMGAALQDLGEFDEALNSINRALELDPNHANAINNRGHVLQELEQLREAESCFLEAIRIQPIYADAYINLGLTQQMQNRLGEAIQTLKNGIKLEPNNPVLHWNLSLALLQNGEFEEGWREYEWRWEMPKFSVFFREVAAPMWNGQALAGKTLYIHAEQGLGDTIHFARYVPLAAKGGTKVIFECVPALTSLFAESFGSEDITVVTDAPVNCDAHAPLLSLPGILKTNLDTIPSEIPYLNPPPERVLKWSDTIREGSGTKVGLVWAGNTTYQNDFRRSIPFELISEILNIPGFRFYSLQIDRLEAATAAINDGIIVEIGTGFSDFSDTASVISELDLVISVDTSVAHLAGALGTPVWILLPRASDWRWLLNRSDSPWYPTMRLFRQPSPGEWEPVIKEVKTALLKLEIGR